MDTNKIFLKLKEKMDKNFNSELNNDEKFLSIHLDTLDLFKEIKLLLTDFGAIPENYKWTVEMALMESYKNSLDEMEESYEQLSSKCMEEEKKVSDLEAIELRKTVNEALELYRSVLVYCFDHILQKERGLINN